MYGHLPPITKTIKFRRTRHAGHCWRNRDELISDVLLWTRSHGWAKAGRPARTYVQQFCADTGSSPEDLPEVMDDREGWRERVWDIRADGVTWWWWWYIAIISTELNGFNYYNLTRIILFDINHLIADSEVLISNIIKTIQSFVHSEMFPSIIMLYQWQNFCTYLNSFKHWNLIQIKLFNIAHSIYIHTVIWSNYSISNNSI